MKLGPLRLPEGVTMKKIRSDSSRGKITCGCSSVAQLELGDGGASVPGETVFMECEISCLEYEPDADGLGETPEDRRRLSSFSVRES